MVHGWIILLTVKYGFIKKPALDLTTTMDTGLIPRMAGHGFQIIHGVGPLSTMDVGLMNLLTVGFWVPGYDWGPAWVSWRTGGDYYGWAPLSPGLHIGISIGNAIPAERWAFVPRRYITSPTVNRYYINNTKNVTIIKNTTVIK